MQECKWEMLLEQLTYQSLAQLLVEGWGDNRKKFFESCEGRYNVLPSLNIKYQAWRHTKHKYQRHVCLDSELLIRSFLIYTYCSTAHSRDSICFWPQCEIQSIILPLDWTCGVVPLIDLFNHRPIENIEIESNLIGSSKSDYFIDSVF